MGKFAQNSKQRKNMEEEKVDIEPVMSGRDKTMNRLREKYPERNLDDEEEMWSALSDEYDQNDQELSRMRDSDKRLTDMFSDSPASAQFLTDMANGGDPFVGLVRNFGTEIRDVLDDPEKQEELAAANAEYLERVAKNKQLEQEYEQNLQVSLDELRAMQQEEGLSDEQIDKAVEYLIGIFQDVVIGKFSRESIKLALNALNHDEDVAAADQDAEIRGRNAKIQEKLRKPAPTDGMPALGGNGGSAGGQRRKDDIFSLANEAQ